MFRNIFCLLFAASLLTACGEDVIEALLSDQEQQQPGQNDPSKEKPATTISITSKNWPFDKWGDNKTKPGDDFYRYCIGKWYDEAKDWDGTYTESLLQIHKYFNQVTYTSNAIPSLQKLLQDSLNVDNAAMRVAAKAYTQSWLDRVEAAKTYQQVGTVIGEMLCNGYPTVLTADVYNFDGTMSMAVMSSTLLDDPDNEDFRKAQRLDTKYTSKLMRLDTRAIGDDNIETILSAMAHVMGLTPGRDFFYFSGDDDLEAFCTQPLAAIKAQLKEDIASFDALFASRAGATAEGVTYQYLISYLYEKYMNYEAAKFLYDQGFYNDAHKERIAELCEEVRSTLATHISGLAWMSTTTKEAARKKLAAMKFFVGYPDNWYSNGLAKLNGNSMVEDVHLLIAANFNISKYVCGRKVTNAVQYLCPTMMNIATDNAFYSPNYNTFFIFPNYMFEPYYREDVLDAYLYSQECLVIGHEMVHGFDSSDAMYDADGVYAVDEDEAPYGWWTEADAREYQRRMQLLIDSYDNLPYEPKRLPGVNNDGTKCLGENIADVGGLNVAFDCYTRHITEANYTEADRQELQRLFLKGWAYSWRHKLNAEYLRKYYQQDVHSSSYARVIGPMQHLDAWYDLFDVKAGQKYYLTPAQRSHIW